jgi:uncharacterized membrane protein YdbT with pleckstrin-like domain
MTERPYKKDRLFGFIAFLLIVASLAMLIPAIWHDWRWLLTAVVTFLFATLAVAISNKYDEMYRERGERE